MSARTTGYCVKQGLVNIRRNKLFSLASVGTIAACVFLIGVVLAVIINVNYMEKELEQRVAVTIFFENGASDELIDEIGTVIDDDDMVERYTFTSAQEAWESFKQDYFADDPELAEGFEDDNPLANSASYTVYLKDIENQEAFVSKMQSTQGVRKVQYSDQAEQTLTSLGRLLGYVSIVLVIILLAVGIFLINNMVMIGISVRRNEIKIMKLIGATNGFVRAPFIIEGVVIGLLGSIIPLAIIAAVYDRLIDFIGERFGVLSSGIPFAPANMVVTVLIPIGLVIGAGIGLVGSAMSIRKHLKV